MLTSTTNFNFKWTKKEYGHASREGLCIDFKSFAIMLQLIVWKSFNSFNNADPLKVDESNWYMGEELNVAFYDTEVVNKEFRNLAVTVR